MCPSNHEKEGAKTKGDDHDDHQAHGSKPPDGWRRQSSLTLYGQQRQEEAGPKSSTTTLDSARGPPTSHALPETRGMFYIHTFSKHLSCVLCVISLSVSSVCFCTGIIYLALTVCVQVLAKGSSRSISSSSANAPPAPCLRLTYDTKSYHRWFVKTTIKTTKMIVITIIRWSLVIYRNGGAR